MIANKDGTLTFVGSDDGKNFWSVPGKLEGGKIKVDFSPKGGPADFSGGLQDNFNITWKDENVWEFMPMPAGSLDGTPRTLRAAIVSRSRAGEVNGIGEAKVTTREWGGEGVRGHEITSTQVFSSFPPLAGGQLPVLP